MTNNLETKPLTFPEIIRGIAATLDMVIKRGNPANEQNFTCFPNNGTDKDYDASLRPESKPSLKEFDDDFYDGYFNVTR